MKKLLCILIAMVFLCAFLCGCSAPQTENSPASTDKPVDKDILITDVLSEGMQKIYAERDTSLPAAVIYSFYGEGGVESYPAYGEDAVNAVLDAVLQIQITGETDVYADDNSSGYSFIGADGETLGSISFNSGNLEANGKVYTVENTVALSGVRFPAEGNFACLASDSPDPKVKEFFEKCDSGMPASATISITGKENKEITDAETIAELVDQLYYVDFTFAFEYAEYDADVYVLTFGMADGTDYSFTFSDYAYIYEFPQPIGKWSYCFDSFDELEELFLNL